MTAKKKDPNLVHSNGRPVTAEKYYNHSLHAYDRPRTSSSEKAIGTLRRLDPITGGVSREYPYEERLGPFTIRVTNCQHYRLYTIMAIGDMRSLEVLGKQASMPDVVQCLSRLAEARKAGVITGARADEIVQEALKNEGAGQKNIRFYRDFVRNPNGETAPKKAAYGRKR